MIRPLRDRILPLPPLAAASGLLACGLLLTRDPVPGSREATSFLLLHLLAETAESNTPDLSRELRKSVTHFLEQNMPPSSITSLCVMPSGSAGRNLWRRNSNRS